MDYGGVLTTSISSSFARFCVENSVSPETLRGVMAAAYTSDLETPEPAPAGGPGSVDQARREASDDSLIGMFETGRIEPDEFDLRLAAALSEGGDATVEPRDLRGRLLAGLAPDEQMLAAVRAARQQGVRTALVSNTWGLRNELEDLGWMFDAVVLSERLGERKPGSAIYLEAARQVQTDPAACVFVDDIPVNVEGAEAVGMQAILHRDASITIPRMEELFAVRLTPPEDAARP